MNMDMAMKMTPRIEPIMARIGLPLIFAWTTLSKFSLNSPTKSSLYSSYSSFSSLSSVFGVLIIKSSSIWFSSKSIDSGWSSSPGW
jgi:hypothetical protein